MAPSSKLGVQSCEISFSSTLEGGGRIRTTSRSRKMKIEFAVVNSMYRLRLPMSTIHHICEFGYATAQSKDDDLTEHYEFNWCLRSPCGCRLLMQRGTQYHNDVLKTRCEEQASLLLSITFLAHTNWSLFRQGCHHQAPGTTTGTTNFTRRGKIGVGSSCLLYTSPSPRDRG